MNASALLLLTASGLLLQSCSTDSWYRTGYETVQNLGERLCLEDLTTECPQRESYDDYQQRRAE